MTVSDKIFELNKQFQKSYYDTDAGFFSYTVTEMIEEIKTFLTTIIDEQHPLRYSVNKHLEVLDQQISDMKNLADNRDANNWVKDKWLNGCKINVSNVCWGFRHECLNFNENILNQVI